ncbi:hypothetical protein O4160_08420 [Rhodococcus sp. IEGM 1401]|uniref:hypothetical protein n=1 Tax=unclassified Rhodococcus (in: high G+C Gram-positive bacteria) TaxID=192944 RepID=UPI0022B512E7|nr:MULTISPECIES: hypothetical protein [unclassified Rhodococcus (in: high G+C Gram-positive bacteria)]MCZ4560865.1 hypothetical protein [Rhodococcus sp. IEGM 1401]MDI9921005.1 hypothetical protein [Rhodococcus sp. IEGM 1372]MDV8033394.1 hypothetical protein [Rhodococcus sp. IEGM 1414]
MAISTTLVRRLPDIVGLGRAAIGLAHMIAPTRANELLAGPDAAVATTRAAARTFGIREIYIGGGLYAATRYAPKLVRPLLRAGVGVDVWDTGAFALTAYLPRRTRVAGCAIAGGFVVAGVLADVQFGR